MPYELQIKPFEKKDGVKYRIIQMTDIALHTSKKRPTTSFVGKLRSLLQFKKPVRIYRLLQNQFNGNTFNIDNIKNNPELVKIIQEEEKKGYKVLISLPRTGIPIFPGEDTVDFINSKNGQRIMRGLAKNKDKDI
jgi:hypothetical protein